MSLLYNVTISNVGLVETIQGDGRRFVKDVSNQIHALAIAGAPSRSHALVTSHNVKRVWGNLYQSRYEIEAGGPLAPYAEIVHEGFPRGARVSIPNSIWAESEEGMAVPVAPGVPYRTRRRSVAGQAANRWLDEAGTAIALRYGAIAY